MNKELINKYKHEFDHWLNEGSVLINSDLGWCPIATEFAWSCNISVDALLVINDEYVEFRKALTEGKTIQLNEAEKFADSNRGWVDLSCKSFGKSTHLFPINYYRIKPDEPKFKVGDFVRYAYSTPARALEINNINGNRYYFTNSKMSCLKHELDPWTPVKDEWCWFYDNKDSKYSHLAQFYDMNISEDNSLSTFMSSPITKWKCCEPFLNSRPSYLKDK